MDSVTVCNMALDAVGARSSIQTIDEQSPEAMACNRHYEQTLKELLRIHTWRWARANVALAVLKALQGTPENPTGTDFEAPEWPWLYSYALPTDCVKIRYIIPQNTTGAATIDGIPLTTSSDAAPDPGYTPPVKFIESGDKIADVDVKVILTNQYQARLVYTKIVTDPNLWDSNFVTAFVGRLAGKICMPVSGDKELMKLAIEAGKSAEEQAKTSDANDGIDVKDWQPEAQAAGGFIDPNMSTYYEGLAPLPVT